MIGVKSAYLIASRGTSGKLTDCYDIGDSFAFYFDEGDGSPYIIVNKTTAKKSRMFVPPISNLRILENGIKLNVSEASGDVYD